MRPSLRMCSRWPLVRISRFFRTLMAKRGLAPLFSCTWRRWRSIDCIIETWESGRGSRTWRAVVVGREELRDEALTRSTWRNSPTARVQTIWKSLSLVDERRSRSLSDLLARKTRRQPHVKDVHQMSLSSEILPRRCSLALGFLALLHFLSAAEYKAANDVFEGPETQMIYRILDEPVWL